MISKLPWRLCEDGDKIYDAEDNVIAEDGKFLDSKRKENKCQL